MKNITSVSPLLDTGRRLTDDQTHIGNSPKKKMWPERSVHIVSHYPVHPVSEHVDLSQVTYTALPENILNTGHPSPNLLQQLQHHNYRTNVPDDHVSPYPHTSRRSNSLLKNTDIPLKPTQMNNPYELQKKTAFDQHTPAGRLSSLAKESFNVQINQYPISKAN